MRRRYISIEASRAHYPAPYPVAVTTLLTRALGPHTVSSIGLGCMNLDHAYGTPPDEAAAVALPHAALDLGITLFDTATLYQQGDAIFTPDALRGGRYSTAMQAQIDAKRWRARN